MKIIASLLGILAAAFAVGALFTVDFGDLTGPLALFAVIFGYAAWVTYHEEA